MPPSVKFLKGSDDTLEILAVPFGGPIGGKDTDGEFFSERTDLCPDWFPVQRPLLYHHGLDDDAGLEAIGRVDSASATKGADGWWVRAQLEKRSRYFAQIKELIERDGLSASSGAMPHLTRRTKDGEITRWPWVELSLTPTPANAFARVSVSPAEAKSHYKSAGITPPPTLDDEDTRSYAESLDDLLDDLSDFTEVTRRHAASRQKVGRSLSASRRKRLADFLDRMRDATSEIEGLLAETAPHAPTEPDGAPATEDEAPGEEQKAATASAPPAPPAPGQAQPTSSLVVMPPGKDAPLKAIFEHLQQTDAFYGAVLSPTGKR